MQRISIDRWRTLRFVTAGALLIACAWFWLDSSGNAEYLPLPHFFIPAALLLLAYRNCIEVDPKRARLAHRIGIGYAFAVRKFETSRLRRITLREETVQSGEDDDSSTIYSLRVSGPAERGVLCTHDILWEARSIAERVARALDVELEMRLFGGSSVRVADRLDLPLAERWRLNGIVKPAPRLEDSSISTISHDSKASEFRTPVAPAPRLAIGVVSVCLIVSLHALYSVGGASASFSVVASALVAIFGGGYIARYTGRDRVRFSRTTVEFRRGYLPFVRTMPLEDIEEILVSKNTVALLGDRKFLLIDRPEHESDRTVQRQFIERQISQRQASIAAEHDRPASP